MPRVVYFEILTSEPVRSAAFYEEVFDWKIRKEDDGRWFASTGAELPGIDGAVVRDERHGFVGIIEVDSIAETVVLVERAGGKIVKPKFAVPGIGYGAYCSDPAGIVFGLIEEDMTAE